MSVFTFSEWKKSSSWRNKFCCILAFFVCWMISWVSCDLFECKRIKLLHFSEIFFFFLMLAYEVHRTIIHLIEIPDEKWWMFVFQSITRHGGQTLRLFDLWIWFLLKKIKYDFLFIRQKKAKIQQNSNTVDNLVLDILCLFQIT